MKANTLCYESEHCNCVIDLYLIDYHKQAKLAFIWRLNIALLHCFNHLIFCYAYELF
jgi:hypothetical protein